VTQADLLRLIAETLDALGVIYMVGGSHAAPAGRSSRSHRGIDAYFARPEDVVLYKLLYARQGGEVHLRDVIGILRVSASDLDQEYLARWVDELGLRASWEDVRGRAG